MIELKRAKSRLSISPASWMLTLEIAKICGWKPAGTAQLVEADAPQGDSLAGVRHLIGWQTLYLANDGQVVTAFDALQLAGALDRAAVESERIINDWSEGRGDPPTGIRNKPGGFRWFSTVDGKDYLGKVALFCRGGEFQIF